MIRPRIFLALAAFLASLSPPVFADTQTLPGDAHSAVHPLPPVPTPQEVNGQPLLYQPPIAPFGVVAQGSTWTCFSRGTNRINACSMHGSETWLATDMGVKLIDRTRRTVTHFTRLDGLPDDRVTAIAADAESAWAIVPTKNGDANIAALCQYARTTGKWRKLRDASREAVPAAQPNYNYGGPTYTPGAPLENTLVAVCPEKACFVLSPSRRDNSALALCYDRRLHVWDEIPCDPSFKAANPSLSITWLDVDRDGVWLGTTAGLLHYRLREKQWQRYLPESMVYAGMKTADGLLWLATYRAPAAKPIDKTKPADIAATQTGVWSLTRFTPKLAAIKQYALPEADPRRRGYYPNYPQTISGISLAEGGIWLTSGSRNAYGVNIPFYRFGPQDESWRTFLPQNMKDMESIPDDALRQPMLPRTTLMTSYFPVRFASWLCTEDNEVIGKALTDRNLPNNRDTDSTLWTSDNRSLMQTDLQGQVLRRYSMSRLALPSVPQVNAVAVLKNSLYAIADGSVLSYDLAKNAWARLPMPRPNWSNPTDERLIPDGDHLWMSTTLMSLRYEPPTEQFRLGHTQQNGGFHLLGVDAVGEWLRGADNLLYRPEPQSGEPETVDLNPLPAGIQEQYAGLYPFGVANGIVWFRMLSRKSSENWLFIGYNPQSKSWTAAYHADKANPQNPSLISAGGKTYIATSEENAVVVCYDGQTNQWTIAAPKHPQNRGMTPITIISADDSEIWCLDMNGRLLLRCDRKTQMWTTVNTPQDIWVQQTGNEVTRDGDSIFMASNRGVWRYSIQTRQWTQLPGFPARELYITSTVVTPQAIWMVARPNNTDQSFGLRFDKQTHQWASWTGAQGFPEKTYPNQLVPDGATAWTLAGNEAYRLNMATNHWDNVSEALTEGKGKVQFTSLLADDRSVWLLPVSVQPLPDKPQDKLPEKGLIIRYDLASGTFSRFDPDPALKLTGSGMQVEKDAVWVPTSQGVYRFDKTAQSWRKVEPPRQALAFAKLDAQRIAQSDKTFWFFGSENAVRWKE